VPIGGPGPYQLRLLSARLRAAGTEGQGLRRELYKAINQAAKPLAAEIRSYEHLAPYMPDRYAAVLAAEISVTATKSTGRNPGVAIKARSRRHRRKVVRLNEGLLAHPLFGDRQHWFTQGPASGGMKPGFFTDPAEKAAPDIRRQVLAAMHDTGQKITGH
jgi:hypothetical protein